MEMHLLGLKNTNVDMAYLRKQRTKVCSFLVWGIESSDRQTPIVFAGLLNVSYCTKRRLSRIHVPSHWYTASQSIFSRTFFSILKVQSMDDVAEQTMKRLVSAVSKLFATALPTSARSLRATNFAQEELVDALTTRANLARSGEDTSLESSEGVGKLSHAISTDVALTTKARSLSA